MPKNVTKNILVIFTVMAAVMLIVYFAYLQNRDFRDIIVSQAQSQLLTTAKSTALTLEEFVSEHMNVLNSLSTNNILKELFKHNNLQDNMHLAHIVNTTYMMHMHDIDALYILDDSGNILLRYPARNRYGTTFNNLADKPGVAYVLKERKAYVTKPFHTTSGKFAISLLQPVYSKDEFVGILRLLVKVKTLSERFVKPVKAGVNGYAQLLDSSGILLAHQNQTYIEKHIIKTRKQLYPDHDWSELENIVRQMNAGKEGVGIYHSVWWNKAQREYVRVLTAYTPVRMGENTWSLSVAMDYNEIARPVNKNSRAMLLYSGFIITIVLLISILFFRHVKKLAIAKSDEKFLAFVNRATDSIFLLKHKENKGLVIVDANNTACEMHGYTKDELMEMPISKLDDSETAKHIPVRSRLLYTGEKLFFDGKHVRKDGTVFPIEVSAQLVVLDNVQFIVSIVRNTTDQKLSEKNLRESKDFNENLINTANVIIVGLDADGQINIFNKKAEEITGYTFDELGNQNWFEVLVPKDKYPNVWDEFSRLMEGGLPKQFTNPILTKMGVERIISWSNNEVMQGDKIVGSISFGLDITESKKAETKIANSLKEKEVLLKEIHHRVKNNMAVISSLLSLQSGYVDDNRYLEMFKESQSRIKSMALVHEKLYQSDDFTHIDVEGYVTSLAENIRSSFLTGDRDVKLNINVDELNLDIDNLVPCGLIMNEILTNSFKYAFNGHDNPEITITMKKVEDGNISLSISDNGIGLPDGYDISKPTGLGHKLIEPLIKQIEGTMEVNVDNGTEFRFIFPEKLETARAD